MDTSTQPDAGSPRDADGQGASPDGKGQREALKRSEKAATREQPENFRDEANADKVVDIGDDRTRNPIEGIDPEEGQGR